MSKIEIDLKDDFQIVEEGCKYRVPEYEVVEGEGLKLTEGVKASNGEYYKIPIPIEIRFVRGSKLGSDNVEPKKGTLHEHLIAMMIHDLKFKNNLVPSKETSIVITKLEEALMWQQRRSIDRAKREVQETYKK